MEGIAQDHTVSIERILAARSGGKKVPRFIVRWMERFFHQDFINGYLKQGYEGADFCRHCLEYLDVKTEVEGWENLDLLPEEARCTVVSNHPLGGIDGIVLLDLFLPRFDGKIRLLVNDFLMEIKGLAPLCIPVNKMGGQARSLPAQVQEAFDSGNEMLIFPAGACSRRIDGKIQDYPWKKTFLTHSVRTGRYVVPVHFIGQNSNRFYRVASLCRFFHIRFNAAMFFLPDEMIRGQHQTVRIVIGKPIPPETFDASRSAYDWAQTVRNTVYNL